MAVNVADLVATLRADVGNFVSGFKAAEAAQAGLAKAGGALDSALARVGVQGVSLGRILTSLNSPTALAGASFAALAAGVGLSLEKYRQMGIEARRLSAVSGLTVTDADDLADKFTLLGLNVGTLDVALLRLSADIDNGGAQLEKLGISIRSASGALKEPGALLLEVRDKISAMTDAAAQNATGMQLFGRGFKELSPAFRATSEEWERLGERANALQPPWSQADQDAAMEMNRRVQELKLSAEGLFMVVSRATYPALVSAGRYVADVAGSIAAQVEALGRNSRNPLEALLAGAAGGRDILGGAAFELSGSRIYTEAEIAAVRQRREGAATMRSAATSPESAMERAQEDLARAEVAIANGASRNAVGVGKLSVQRLELGTAGAFDAKRQQLARETELVQRAASLQTTTEAAAADARLGIIARERAAVEEMFDERLRILRASSDYEINAELTLQNARAQALAQTTAQEESARTQRLQALREEQLAATERGDRLTQAAEAVRGIEEQVHEQRLRNLNRGTDAERAATAAKIAGAERGAAAELRALDQELSRMVRTVEVEQWAADQRVKIREKLAQQTALAEQQDRAKRKQVAEDSAELTRDAAVDRQRAIDDTVVATYQAEGKMYDAARASAAAQTRVVQSEYAKRTQELDKMLREGSRTAEAVEQARVHAAAKASAEIVRAQMGLYGAQKQAVAAGAGVSGAPGALKGLSEINRIREEAATMQQALRAASDSGGLMYREVNEAGREFTENLIGRLEAMTPAFTRVPSVVERQVRELVTQMRRGGGFENIVNTGPMGEFRTQLDSLRGAGNQVLRVGDAAGKADSALASFGVRMATLAEQAAVLTASLRGLEGAMSLSGGDAKARAYSNSPAVRAAVAEARGSGTSAPAEVPISRVIDSLSPENAGRILAGSQPTVGEGDAY